MHITILKYLVLFLFFGSCGFDKANEELHVVTFNIRYDNPNDGINRWAERVPIVESYFSEEKPDIIGMQEVLHNQLLDFQEILPEYSYVGTGRDDGEMAGEYSPIFFRDDIFTLVDHSQFWLSETPDVPGSRSWDSAITRIVTWAELEHNATGKTIYAFNTHFDHRGELARRQSTDLMSEKMNEIAGDAPLVVTGDFNIRKNHPSMGSALYYNLIGRFKDDNSLHNAEYASLSPVTSAGATSTGFNSNWQDRPPHAIDYIFANHHFNVESYRVDHVMEGDVFISDHWPVVSILSFSE